MKKRYFLTGVTSAIGFTICTAGLAFAQYSYADSTANEDAANRPKTHQRHSQHRHYQRIPLEQRLGKLKSALQIQSNQEGAWQAFAAAAQTAQDNRKAFWGQNHQATQSLPLPQRIDRREVIFQQMQTDRQAVGNALKQLYGSLTQPQQAILDQHFSHHRKPHIKNG